MTAYRVRYAELEKKGAQVIAISMDDRETLARFRKELGAEFPFIPDPEGRIAALFGVRGEGASHADRKTFVIGEGRKVLAVQEGMFAIDPGQAIEACPLHRPKAAPATRK